MINNSFTVFPDDFMTAIDFVMHDSQIQLAHLMFADDKPLGSLTLKPCYTLFGTENGASVSKMFELAKSGESSTDRNIFWILSESKQWVRQPLPQNSLGVLSKVLDSYSALRNMDEEFSEWYNMFHTSPSAYSAYATDPLLQEAQKTEDAMNKKRAQILENYRNLEQELADEYGFDLEKYSTVDDLMPYRMDHVMDEAYVHAIEYYFNPTPLNTLAFNCLKPLYDREAKKLLDVFETYRSVDVIK